MENTNFKVFNTSDWIDMSLVKEREREAGFDASGSTRRRKSTNKRKLPEERRGNVFRNTKEENMNNLASKKRKVFTDLSNKPHTLSVRNDGRRNSFEDIPRIPSPPYKYRRGPCRKKNERARLPGQCCDHCHSYYENLIIRDGYTEEEVQEVKNKFSRHRDKYPIRSSTPPGFWNPVFSDSDRMKEHSDSD